MRRARIALIALVTLSAGPMAVASAADQPTFDTGWWWMAQTDLIPLPGPPHVPEGGLVVGRGVEGPTAVSAVRTAIPATTGQLTLSLTVQSDTSATTPTIDACVTTNQWEPASAGTWEDRPAAACSAGRAQGSADDDGTIWSFDVTTLARGGNLDVVLVPGAAGDGDAGLPFEVVLEPPGTEAMVATLNRPDVGQNVDPPVSRPASTPIVLPPSRPSADPPSPAAWQPTDVAAVDVPTDVEVRVPRGSAVARQPRPGLDQRNRLAAAALVTTALGAIFLAWRRAGGDGRERGVAQFAAVRRGSPPPL